MTSITSSLQNAYSYSYLSSSSVNVARTSNTGVSSSAVELSTQAGLVANLSGASLGSTYDAAGILNSIVQAGQASGSASSDNSGLTASQSQDLGVVGTLAAPSSTSGVYSANGLLSQLPSQWSDVLKSNPELASGAAISATNLNVVGSLISTVA